MKCHSTEIRISTHLTIPVKSSIVVMKSGYFYLLSLLSASQVSSLRVVVAGYNKDLAVFEVTGEEISPAGEWRVDQDMTWLQLDGQDIWAGHEVGEYEGEAGSVVSRWTVLGNGQLGRLNSVGTGSVYTAHLLVDKTQAWMFILANAILAS